jgi:choline dehydrogenase-like flavoprotein
MGRDLVAEVAPKVRAPGIEGPLVADASLMLETPNTNTNAPTNMIAERAAEWLGA